MSSATRIVLLLCGLLAASATGCHRYACHGKGGPLKSSLSGIVHSPQGEVCGKGGCGKGTCGKGGCGACGVFGGGCHAGCGEVVSWEWFNDPPDCCDPCHEYYGYWTGPRDDCHRLLVDPLLWVLALGHKHCRPWWAHAPCPYGYNEYGFGHYGYDPYGYGHYGPMAEASPNACGCAQCSHSEPVVAAAENPPQDTPLPTPAATAERSIPVGSGYRR